MLSDAVQLLMVPNVAPPEKPSPFSSTAESVAPLIDWPSIVKANGNDVVNSGATRSWQELGGEDFSRYTDFRFDLTPEMIAHNRQVIYGAIQPKCHQYRTYPHAREQLDGLYEKLTSAPSRQ